MTRQIRISVRALVEHHLLRGDLSAGFDRLARPNNMAGIRGHQKIQRSRPSSYSHEVAVAYTAESGPYTLEIQGRIDGVYEQKGHVVVEEIKTTQRDLDSFIDQNQGLHWAQVRVYAALFASKQEEDELRLQLTYWQVESNEIRTFFRDERAEDLFAFLHGLIKRHLEWVEKIDTCRERRDLSIRESEFPYATLRDGQACMMEQVSDTIAEQGQTLIQAPTGTGKTVAALFPALKALAQDRIELIFYLTARTTGRAIAEKTLEEMRSAGLRIKSLTITAKEKACFNPEKNCNGEECPYARGYYDRMPVAREALFTQDVFTREGIAELAAEFRICPFELSLDLALWMDVIICDYNYAFDPRVYLRRFFLDPTANCAFLVDEAHNLVDRAREMFSAEVRKARYLELRRLLKDKSSEIYKLAGKINAKLLEKKQEMQPELMHREKERPDELLPLLRRFCIALERGYGQPRFAALRPVLQEHYFEALWFQRVAELFDETYITYTQTQDRDLRIRLFCVDPSVQLRAAFARSCSAVLYSATLTPMPYFARILGLLEETSRCVLPSPFPPDNLMIVANSTVSTYYRHRSSTRAALTRAIGALTESKAGNFMVFFPSYAYMQMVHPLYVQAFPHHEVLLQRPGMSEDARSEFLSCFARENSRTLVGFAVMGGIFGEGIDLMGDRLSGAAIVGVGLPGITPEREIIREHFDQDDTAGFHFAYLYPGMIRVLQAAGRVIRSENDQGAVLLIDPRYSRPQYYELFPAEWQVFPLRDPDETVRHLRSFWQGKGQDWTE
ncbi:MAG: ATP-dependent DNA helicase [Candidatus Aminicenantaceae bacterium]